MALSKLINNQVIIIDNHKQGCREIHNWDDVRSDIHIDKKTNSEIDGVNQEVRIKIPINSERPIKIENARKQAIQKIPRVLRLEITQALEDREIRTNFVNEVLEVLEDFSTALSSEQRAKQVLTRISKHFDLNWPVDVIADYAKEALLSLTLEYSGSNEEVYFSKIDHEKIEIGQYDEQSIRSRKKKR
ncbi:hypothetical protein A9168_13335 [Macellibacteroides sp. HH-ZS]|nr:hypothetical protein A9168_13335 [Macellibacteroides sp. HH-ZS]